MKEPKEWTEADLLNLTALKEEDKRLEFKACPSLDRKNDKKKDEISKDVSAFANSEGGTIVYGIIEDKKHRPHELDEGYDTADISKEWLDQVIHSRIRPRIDNLIINPVELATMNPDRVAYVVSIPQSDRAPHQASDKRYYKRFNFHSVAMEDYEVRDVMFRQRTPRVEIQRLCIRAGSHGPKSFEIRSGHTRSGFFQNIRVALEVRNAGKLVAQHYAAEIRIPRIFALENARYELHQQTPTLEWRQEGSDILYLIKGTAPLFPEQVKVLGDAVFCIDSRTWSENADAVISAVLYADNMPPIRSTLKLCNSQEIGDIIRERELGR